MWSKWRGYKFLRFLSSTFIFQKYRGILQWWIRICFILYETSILWNISIFLFVNSFLLISVCHEPILHIFCSIKYWIRYCHNNYCHICTCSRNIVRFYTESYLFLFWEKRKFFVTIGNYCRVSYFFFLFSLPFDKSQCLHYFTL